MHSEAKKKKNGDSDGGDSIVTKEREGKKNAVVEVKAFWLHYTREVGTINSSLRCKAYHGSNCKEGVQFWRKLPSYCDGLSQMN